ncbi:zinc finger CCCH domain-containing protein 39-like [Vicia villosa]|uniref:zinc finger CCCH domain-containing protein 39-like n=1 Tax=Vicia villosa TaxID=3911 RepID=UPI00273AC415|nr:zinc finger CCCH domain-containing protein 39-like [Vicia villosa]
MTDPDKVPIFNMPPPPFASSNTDINNMRPQFPMNNERFEPSSSLDRSHSFNRPRISDNKHSNELMGPPSRMNHPPSNRPTDNIFFKTRLCSNYSLGSCRKGEYCSYAHGKEELRKPPPNWQELERLQLGGNRENYSSLHEDTAKFRNDSGETRESSAIVIETIGNNFEGNKTGTKPPRGTCWKTRICPKWKDTRSCSLGDYCNYAHGDADLRIPGGGIETAFAISNSSKAGIPTLRTTGSSAKYAPTLPSSVAIANSSKAVIPTLRTTGSTAKYLPAVLASAPAETEEEKKAKKELLRNKKLNKVNRIYGDWIDDLPPDRPDLPREP